MSTTSDNNDMAMSPPDDPKPLEDLFGEVFALVDRVVEGVTEDQVEARLNLLLGANGYSTDLGVTPASASCVESIKRTDEKKSNGRYQMSSHVGVEMGSTDIASCAGQLRSQVTQEPNTEQTDLRKRLQSLLIHAALVDPAQQAFVAESVSALRSARPGTGSGSRMLDVVISFHDLLLGASQDTAVTFARRGLSDDNLIQQANPLAAYGCCVLIAADLDEVIPLLDAWIAVAHRRGSVVALASAKCLRGLAWLVRGDLTEAEANLRDSLWAVTITAQEIGVPVVVSYLAETLMEQGRLDEAEAMIAMAGRPEPIPRAGYWAWLLSSQARLLTLQGRIPEGLQAWLACGHQFGAHGGQNPAVLPWRSGAALVLHRLGRSEEAWELAAEEITLARRWGAPTALGHALRVAGLIRGGRDGLTLLREAATTLASSPAKLEYATALLDLGAALRRAGRRSESRQDLRHGVELAHICGATPLVERGWAELRASGARRQPARPSGLDALTPSEQRVAELAVAGYSDHDIAQALFTTTNTVQAHLTRTYRKLGVNGRADLNRIALSPPRSPYLAAVRPGSAQAGPNH